MRVGRASRYHVVGDGGSVSELLTPNCEQIYEDGALLGLW